MIEEISLVRSKPGLAKCVWPSRPTFDPASLHVVGVLEGEGVGSEIVPVALDLLDTLCEHSKRKFQIRFGGEIGCAAIASCGTSLSPEVTEFVSSIFSDDGALFCGPGGERFVYDLRRRFDLFCKFTPLEPFAELAQAGSVRPNMVESADIVAVRENLGGVYQGEWATETDADSRTTATHRFHYTDDAVRRILAVALQLAAGRRKRAHVILKPGGIPSISKLWRRCAEEMAPDYAVEVHEMEVDNAVYQLIANPQQFDVIVSPNMFGDILADCGALLLASRGLSFSGNFNERGSAAYQTGHGAARDISGTDSANPTGQILSLGMMLRESFDWPDADAVLRQAVRRTLREGVCTRDVAWPGSRVAGTRTFGREVRQNLRSLLANRFL